MVSRRKRAAPAARPTFFATSSGFRAWLEAHHTEAQELWVGLHKKDSGKPSITWPEAVDEALCFGWIDGLRKRVNESSYMNRFTPRRLRSNWSAINIRRVLELTKLGLMQPAGLKAFQSRRLEKCGVYSYERRKTARLARVLEQRLRNNKKAWKFFRAQAPSYQRAVSWWIISAKRKETQLKRLATLIKDSGGGRRIGLLTRPIDG